MNATATLLVVDDERTNLDIISEHLDELHYDIVQATHGAEALALLLSAPEKFDLLVLDHLMPGMMALRCSQLYAKTSASIVCLS